MQFELTDAEVDLLRKLLDRETRDLSYEIADTDNSSYRDELNDHRDRVRAILERLGGPPEADEG